MQKINTKTKFYTLNQSFEKFTLKYPTKYSHSHCKQPKIKLGKIKFKISNRGPSILNIFIDNNEKEIKSLLLFKSKIKSKLMIRKCCSFH